MKINARHRFAFLAIIIIWFQGCKRDVEETCFSVKLDMLIQQDANFEVFYLVEDQQNFSEKNKKTVQVNAGSQIQEVVFNLPTNASKKKFRIDFGNEHLKSNSFFLKGITIGNCKNQTIIAHNNIPFFFVFNEFLQYDTTNGELRFSTAGGRFDPYMVSKPILQKKIKIEL